MIDLNFFKTWSPESAYVLGFFAADGNMIKTKRGTHFISFHAADEELLKEIQRCMKSKHKLSLRHGITGNLFRFQIGSKEMFFDLLKLGFTPYKTRRMKVPQMPRKYQQHFIRGYFDGDGNVWSGYINKKRKNSSQVLQVAFTSCNKDFLKDLWDMLKTCGIEGGCIYSPKNKNFSRLMFSTRDSLKVGEVMYNEASKLFLARKKLRFQQFKELRA